MAKMVMQHFTRGIVFNQSVTNCKSHHYLKKLFLKENFHIFHFQLKIKSNSVPAFQTYNSFMNENSGSEFHKFFFLVGKCLAFLNSQMFFYFLYKHVICLYKRFAPFQLKMILLLLFLLLYC